MTYESLAIFAQQGGFVYFMVVFTIVCIYALWPNNKKKFDNAALMPLATDNDAPMIVEK
jgi:cytochrome c oxidase cbb3-type subunit 4